MNCPKENLRAIFYSEDFFVRGAGFFFGAGVFVVVLLVEAFFTSTDLVVALETFFTRGAAGTSIISSVSGCGFDWVEI